MSVHTARALIGWMTSYGSLWQGVRTELLRYCIEVNVPKGGEKIAVLRLYHGATRESAVELL
jgi:hypothetical protein